MKTEYNDVKFIDLNNRGMKKIILNVVYKHNVC